MGRTRPRPRPRPTITRQYLGSLRFLPQRLQTHHLSLHAMNPSPQKTETHYRKKLLLPLFPNSSFFSSSIALLLPFPYPFELHISPKRCTSFPPPRKPCYSSCSLLAQVKIMVGLQRFQSLVQPLCRSSTLYPSLSCHGCVHHKKGSKVSFPFPICLSLVPISLSLSLSPQYFFPFSSFLAFSLSPSEPNFSLRGTSVFLSPPW